MSKLHSLGILFDSLSLSLSLSLSHFIVIQFHFFKHYTGRIPMGIWDTMGSQSPLIVVKGNSIGEVL